MRAVRLANPPKHHYFSAPLKCADYTDCSTAAAARCDADTRCHSFALFDTSWHGNRAQFFAKGASGLTKCGGWSAFSKATPEESPEASRRPGRDQLELAAKTGELPLLVSDGPAGPWRHVAAQIPAGVNGGSLSAPWILKNGTTFWV